MKKFIFLILLFVSCGKTSYKIENTDKYIGGSEVNFIEIEGCEYIVIGCLYDKNSHKSITHKGNCKNPLHLSK